ncbi:MAG: urea ABC transporter permease subunit UrtB [Gammaproteobacteria bacterium]|nr:urea ABC transporter permease subunit UrtB [Gammaproteobacteria bacterium]MDH5694278.1 urea ABC transporter permease subunit UrtB [Gammaproteobacteria bacterium]
MLRNRYLFRLILLSLTFLLVVPQVNASTAELTELVDSLSVGGLNEKQQTIEKIAQIDHPIVEGLLKGLLEGEVYYLKETNKVYFRVESEEVTKIKDIFSDAIVREVDSFDVKKVSINNRIRKILKTELAKFDLLSPDNSKREAAVRKILEDSSSESVAPLRNLVEKERNETIRELMQIAMAFVDAGPESKPETRLAAIEKMGESLSSEVKARLEKLLLSEQALSGEERNSTIVAALKKSISKMDSNLQRYAFMEKVFFGLSLGSVLLLAAIGLAITFGVMGVINMAHGELIMIGAYTTYVVQLMMPNYIEYSLVVAVPAAFLISGLVGIAIERGVIRFLYGRPLETLLATFGISLVLQQAVRSIFSPLNRSVETPEWMSGAMQINSALSLTYNRMYIIVFALIVFALLLLLLKKTKLGLQVRAVSQNRPMANAMGIRSGWVDAMTFGLGSGIAGVAGVALSQLTNVGPNMGQAYIIDSFMVVVFGGVGNLWGTLVGAMSLGVINKFLEPWAGAVLAKILVLVFIILFIQRKPRGLFPQKGRAAEG